MFPLPGSYANVCDSQDAEEHGYSERNLGKNNISIFYRKTWSTKKATKWVRNTIKKKYICVYCVYINKNCERT